MAGQFRVEPAGVSLAAGRLDRLAGELRGLEVAGPLRGGAAAVPGSGTGEQAGRLAGDLLAALELLVGAVQAMGAAAGVSVGNYLAADARGAQLFASVGAGLTGPPAGSVSGSLFGPGTRSLPGPASGSLPGPPSGSLLGPGTRSLPGPLSGPLPGPASGPVGSGGG